MALATASAPPSQHGTNSTEGEVSITRLYVLRATYLLLIVGLGTLIVPILIDHPPMTRGVIPSLLGGVWLLAFIGIKYPLQMLPLLCRGLMIPDLLAILGSLDYVLADIDR